MREILFRGKTLTGEWVEGAYYKQEEFYGTNEEADIIITSKETLDFDQALYYAVVIPETVGQYTGLTDKNGTKIFEGDIVKHEYYVFISLRKKELKTKIGYVDYSCDGYGNGYWAYWWDKEKERRCNFGINSECEVIGNIHDNPELLGGGEE